MWWRTNKGLEGEFPRSIAALSVRWKLKDVSASIKGGPIGTRHQIHAKSFFFQSIRLLHTFSLLKVNLQSSKQHHTFSPFPSVLSRLSSIPFLDTLPCCNRKYVGIKIVQSCKYPSISMIAYASTDALDSFPELPHPPHAQQTSYAHHMDHQSYGITQMMQTRRFAGQSLVLI